MIDHYRSGNDLYASVDAEDLASIPLSNEACEPGTPMDVVLGESLWASLGLGGPMPGITIKDDPDGIAFRFTGVFEPGA